MRFHLFTEEFYWGAIYELLAVSQNGRDSKDALDMYCMGNEL